jgi:nitrogen fixation protein NifB
MTQVAEAGMMKNRVRTMHPCFGAAPSKARIHLPICPSCNIECAFCRRALNTEENRPGVAAFVLPPEKAGTYLKAALEKCPEISVVGVAGPGDTLVGDNLFKAFRIVDEEHPELLKCISTNGLLLDKRADELIRIGVDTLTVTVNAVNPEILARIVKAIWWEGKRISGAEGAEILILNQLAGIRKMAEAGTIIKINTVLTPGINDDTIAETARAVSKAGAMIFNIIPLIPQHLLADSPEPSCAEIESARKMASAHIDVFRHCQHSRADAIGIPGVSDVSKTVYKEFAGRAEEVFSHG